MCSMEHKVLVCISTFVGDWRQQISDIKKKGITECALFMTGLKKEEKPELFECLSDVSQLAIPFIHLKSDIAVKELELFCTKYKTQFFNIHSENEYPQENDLSAFSSKILLENSSPITAEEAGKWGGICLDISHLENDRLMGSKQYDHICDLLEQFPIHANHASGIAKVPAMVPGGIEPTYDRHVLESVDQYEYIRNIPKKYLSPIIALEITNDIDTQLQAKEYIENILKS